MFAKFLSFFMAVALSFAAGALAAHHCPLVHKMTCPKHSTVCVQECPCKCCDCKCVCPCCGCDCGGNCGVP